jgi:hypothetical protein
MATETYLTMFCIDTEAGVMEGCPATFVIDTDSGLARLETFRIGDWRGDRAAAVAMTGKQHVAAQEARIAVCWMENVTMDVLA